jgi:hypothetical protein
MKVYVAGKFQKKDLVLEAYKKIEELGHEVSYDWTTHKSIKPYSENVGIAEEYSENELEGISKSDVFIYITDEKGTTLPMEFGSALMSAKIKKKPLIYVVGEFNDKSPWFFNKLVKRRNTLDGVFEDSIWKVQKYDLLYQRIFKF